VVVVVDVEVVWAVEVVWVVEVVVNMVGGRRGGGRLGVVGVGDGHRRGGDRRGKVDAGGCRRVADVAWLGCGRCRVVDVARSTRGVVVVSSTWRGRGWVWSLLYRRRGEVDTGGRRRVVNVARSTWGLVVVSSMWRGHGWDVVVVVVASSTWQGRRGGSSRGMAGGRRRGGRHPWGRRRRPRGVGVADYLDVAWQGSSSWWTWRGVVVVPNPAWLWVSIREGEERWWWSTAAAGAVW